MKHCPTCKKNYPASMKYCPEDQTQLTTSSELEPGMIIRDKYEVLSRIGAGGMAEVYRAKHLAFNEQRAIKVVNPKFVDDESFIRRFKREAVVSRKLRHPHAIDVEDLDTTEDGRPFIVMEVVNGPSLRGVMEDHYLGTERALEIACQVAEALAAAHRIGITHRDIKPENIILTKDHEGKDFVKVLDFGIAKVKEGALSVAMQSKLTLDNMVVGTPQYMSPEQAEGKIGDDLDGRADIYSLGIMLYEMTTGSLPFQGGSLRQWRDHQLFTVPAPPRLFKPALNIPQRVSDLVMKALEKKREQRFQTMEEMLQAMREAQSSLGAVAETFIVKDKGMGAAAPSGYQSPPPSYPSPEPPSSYQSPPARPSYEQRPSPPPQQRPSPPPGTKGPIYIQPNYANSAPGVDQGVMTPPPRVPTPGPQPIPAGDEGSQDRSRRTQKRYPCNADVQVRVAGSSAIPSWGTITEISQSGCYIEMPGPSPMGTMLELVLRVGGGELNAQGQVQSYHPPIGMGVMFVEMNSVDYQRLRQFLDSLPEPGAPVSPQEAETGAAMIESHTPAPQPVPGPAFPGQRPYQPPRPQPQPVAPRPSPRREMFQTDLKPRPKWPIWLGVGLLAAVLAGGLLYWKPWAPSGPTDETMRADIERTLKSSDASDTLRGSNVVVLVKNHYVTLTGDVQSAEDKTQAQTLAMKESGVTGVANDLNIVQRIARTDKDIQADVDKVLQASANPQLHDLKSAVKDKVATLSGEVTDPSIAVEALTLARAVNGVNDIKNEIHIKSNGQVVNSGGGGGGTTDTAAQNRAKARKALGDAQTLYKQGQYNQALAKLNGITQLDPTLANDVRTLNDQIDAALHPKVNPNVQLAQDALKMGKSLMNQGKYDEAIKSFKRAKELDPNLGPEVAKLTDQAINAKYTEEQWNRTHKQ